MPNNGFVGDSSQRSEALQRRNDLVGVGGINRSNAEPTDPRTISQQFADAEVADLQVDDDRATRQRLQHGRYGTHARREGQACPTLNDTEYLFEGRHGGIAVAAVRRMSIGSVGRREDDRCVQRLRRQPPGDQAK